MKAGRLIQKKGYTEKEALDMAVKFFDQIEAQKNLYGFKMHIEPMIEKIVPADVYYSKEYQRR